MLIIDLGNSQLLKSQCRKYLPYWRSTRPPRPYLNVCRDSLTASCRAFPIPSTATCHVSLPTASCSATSNLGKCCGIPTIFCRAIPTVYCRAFPLAICCAVPLPSTAPTDPCHASSPTAYCSIYDLGTICATPTASSHAIFTVFFRAISLAVCRAVPMASLRALVTR